jgi:sulfur-carrier protein adenylyltransferase/sulfurtransferase
LHRLVDYDRFRGAASGAAGGGRSGAAEGVASGVVAGGADGMAPTGAREGQMDVAELKAKIDRGDRFVLLDVREPHEYRICSIPGSVPLPLGELAKRVGELDPAAEIVVHCRSGVRSAKAAEFLKKAGFAKVSNLTGGILAWSDKIDPRVPKY